MLDEGGAFMNEIEIKVKLDNKDEVVEMFKKEGCTFSDVKHQVDTVFLENSVKDFNIKPGMIVLRIRTIGNKNLITLKQRKEKTMESKEIEFGVDNRELCKDLITTLGYKEMVTIDKKRIETKYDNFNICIDDVDKLGSFIEIEILTSEEGMANYYEEKMIELCRKFGIDPNNRINSHYDTMLYNLNK